MDKQFELAPRLKNLGLGMPNEPVIEKIYVQHTHSWRLPFVTTGFLLMAALVAFDIWPIVYQRTRGEQLRRIVAKGISKPQALALLENHGFVLSSAKSSFNIHVEVGTSRNSIIMSLMNGGSRYLQLYRLKRFLRQNAPGRQDIILIGKSGDVMAIVNGNTIASYQGFLH